MQVLETKQRISGVARHKLGQVAALFVIELLHHLPEHLYGLVRGVVTAAVFAVVLEVGNAYLSGRAQHPTPSSAAVRSAAP